MHLFYPFRKILITLFSLFFLCSCSHAQPPAPSVEELIEQSDWFTLQKVYDSQKNSLSPFIQALAQAFLSSAFNRPQAIEQLIDLAQRFPVQLGYDHSIDLTLKIAMDLHSQNRNREALAAMRELISAIRPHADPETLFYFQRLEKQFSRLAAYKLYYLQRPEQDTRLPLITRLLPQNGSAFLLEGRINGRGQEMLLDTGAGANFITEEIAAREGFTVIDDSVRVTGVRTDFGKLVLADSISLGEIRLYNVPFYVLDMTTDHPEANKYFESLQVIIGVPLLTALEEIRFDFVQHEVLFPLHPSHRTAPYSNLCQDQGSLLVEVSSAGTPLVMQLDCGSGLSSLSHNYFLKNRSLIEEAGIRSDTYIAGIGGIREIPIYLLSDFPFAVNDKTKTLPQIVVETEESGVSYEDGMFGADMFSAFEKMTINFKEMFVETE